MATACCENAARSKARARRHVLADELQPPASSQSVKIHRMHEGKMPVGCMTASFLWDARPV